MLCSYLFANMQNYIIKNEADSLEIKVYDDIGKGGFFWDEISAQSIIDQVEMVMPKNITLRINSGGGSVFEGLTIYNYLKSYNGRVKVIVDGLAASIASIIAMAGNRVEMGEGALMMIHDPMSGVMGNAQEMRKMADVLDKVGGSLADIYVNKTGLDKAKVLQMMSEETWLTAQEAVEMGFANKAIGQKVNNENLLQMVAKYQPPKSIVNSLNNHKVEKSFKDQLRDFFGLSNKEDAEEIRNELVAPIKNELEAKLKAEQEAKAELENQLAEAQKVATDKAGLENKLAEMQANLDAMKNSGAPQESATEDHSSEHEEENQMSKLESLENALIQNFSASKKAEYEKVLARQQKIKEIEKKHK